MRNQQRLPRQDCENFLQKGYARSTCSRVYRRIVGEENGQDFHSGCDGGSRALEPSGADITYRQGQALEDQHLRLRDGGRRIHNASGNKLFDMDKTRPRRLYRIRQDYYQAHQAIQRKPAAFLR
jgi:hypothetical protein